MIYLLSVVIALRCVFVLFFYPYSNISSLRQEGKEKKVNIYSLRKLEKGTLEQVDGNTQTDAAFQPGVNSLQEQCRWGEDVYP